VVTDGTAIDRAATAALRSELGARRRSGSVRDFDYGPEREAYEGLWSDPVRTALVKALQQYPGRLQRFLMDRVSRLVEESDRQGIAISPEAVPGLVSSALAGLRR
jgi:N-methylhydantoinase B